MKSTPTLQTLFSNSTISSFQYTVYFHTYTFADFFYKSVINKQLNSQEYVVTHFTQIKLSFKISKSKLRFIFSTAGPMKCSRCDGQQAAS